MSRLNPPEGSGRETRGAKGSPSAAERAAAGAGAPRCSLLTRDDLHLFNEGTHYRLYRHLGSHLMAPGGERGAYFSVWAPDAGSVSVTGDFNGWDRAAHRMAPAESSGIWELFIPGIEAGARYKYHVIPRGSTSGVDKADPFAVRAEEPPKTASVVWDLSFTWNDARWMEKRAAAQALTAPISIYEVHLGSWRRVPEEGGRPLSYRELAPRLADYVSEMGFTHVQFLPVMEHPFFGSWGYQTTGYFAPTSRYGPPQDFMYLVDTLHQAEIGVILDWVPSHFPNDEHGLARFDGAHLYEHLDPRKGFHPDWNTHIFNYGRNEVRSFLISSALFWLEHYHADALRVDAVASMLYLDYSRNEGEWIPNEYGGRENLEAIDFMRRFNAETYRSFPGTQTIAEESTAWPMVSRPVYVGGLGFGMKWDMGWMHDTLTYMRKEPVHRRYHHNEITFRMIYAFNENFVLPLSHDEVVHGKGSLLRQMPGDDWQKFASLRLLLAFMYAQPGKKLLFMGCEIGQWDEWDHESSLDWHLLEHAPHQGIRRLVTDLNRAYRTQPALHERDFDPSGFEWIDAGDSDQSCLSFIRRGGAEAPPMSIVLNFTPVPRTGYRVGVPLRGHWREILNTDAREYGGGGIGNMGGVEALAVPYHGRACSLSLQLPPLGAVFLRHEGRG